MIGAYRAVCNCNVGVPAIESIFRPSYNSSVPTIDFIPIPIGFIMLYGFTPDALLFTSLQKIW